MIQSRIPACPDEIALAELFNTLAAIRKLRRRACCCENDVGGGVSGQILPV
jgi:hypothetical protein